MYIKKAVVKENGAICVYSRDKKETIKREMCQAIWGSVKLNGLCNQLLTLQERFSLCLWNNNLFVSRMWVYWSRGNLEGRGT